MHQNHDQNNKFNFRFNFLYDENKTYSSLFVVMLFVVGEIAPISSESHTQVPITRRKPAET